MDKLNLPVFIACPSHPAEVIQRVDPSVYARKHLYCLECALQSENPKTLLNTLDTLPNFVKSAARFYEESKTKLNPTTGPSPQLSEILKGQNEAMEKLKSHISEEKRKIEEVFNDLTNKIVETVNQKKFEFYEMLDKQEHNLSSLYFSFSKQLTKAYPTVESISMLFPNEEVLRGKLARISKPSELEAFLKDIKEDMNQGKLAQNFAEIDEGSRSFYFESLATKLKENANVRPVVDLGNIDIAKLKASVKETLDKLLDKVLTISTPIPDGGLAQGVLESNILSREDFEVVKQWMPTRYKFVLKLLYRGTRDGFTPQAFHFKCDNKGPTLTFIKCRFDRSTKVSVIGGFLEKDWHQWGDYLHSDEAFMYSLSLGIKCPINNYRFAAYGGPKNGPRFGNCDLQIYASNGNQFDQTLLRPGSYLQSARLVESEKYSGGEINFKIIEMEVFQVR